MKTEIDEDSFIVKYSELNLLYDTLKGVALAKVGFFRYVYIFLITF